MPARGYYDRILYLVIFIVYLLHNDLWFWSDSRLVGGIPIGLLYQIAFCGLTSLVMVLLVKFSWPQNLEVNQEEEKIDS